MRRYGWLEIFVGAMMSALVVDVFVQVVLRYVTYQPLAWTEEIARLLFIWICLLGAAIGVKRGTHFTVTLLLDAIPVPLASMCQFFLRIVEAGFYLTLTSSGIIVTRVAHLQHSPSLEYPMSLSYVVIAISGALMTVFSVRLAYLALFPGGHRA